MLLADLNIGQPGDGFTVVSAMKRVQPIASTFILTGYPDFESALNAIRSQVDDYFSKPVDISRLLHSISTSEIGRQEGSKPDPLMSVPDLVESSSDTIAEQWLSEILNDPEAASIQLTREERLDHLPEFLKELTRGMREGASGLAGSAGDGARKHGRTRYSQGYSISQLMFETRILQQVLRRSIQKQLVKLDVSTLVPGSFDIGEAIHAATEMSLAGYQPQIPRSLQVSFSHLYKSPHLGLAIADIDRILDANDALLGMLGYTREDLVAGKLRWLEITREKYRPLEVNALEQLRQFGTCVPFETEYILRDGSTFPFLIEAVRLSSDPMQWCAYILDLRNHRKLQEAERRIGESESRHALINQLAHEINNPLAALMFTVHLLGSQPDLPRDAVELIESTNEMLLRIAKSVRLVLSESRPVAKPNGTQDSPG